MLLAGPQEAAEQQVECQSPKQFEHAINYTKDLAIDEKEPFKLAASNWL